MQVFTHAVYRNPNDIRELTIVQGVLYFRSGSPQHHPRLIARSSRALPSPSTNSRRFPLCLLTRVLCTRSHRTTSTCSPYRIPSLSDLILSRHFVLVSVCSPRAWSENVNVRVFFRRHGSTRAVLGTQAVWTGRPRMDRLYRYPLQTENSRIPPAWSRRKPLFRLAPWYRCTLDIILKKTRFNLLR